LAHANLGRFVKHYIDAFERLIDKLSVTNVTLNEFGCRI
jgi:hypothetical protein